MQHYLLRCTTYNPSNSHAQSLEHNYKSSMTYLREQHSFPSTFDEPRKISFPFLDSVLLFLLHSRVMSSKQATSPFASVVDGDDAMSQEHLSWEKEESAEAHGTPQLPLHSLLHGKAHPDEMQPLSSVPPESDWDSLVSAQQRMVRHVSIHT